MLDVARKAERACQTGEGSVDPLEHLTPIAGKCNPVGMPLEQIGAKSFFQLQQSLTECRLGHSGQAGGFADATCLRQNRQHT